MLIVVIFIFGLVFGSFVHALVWRMHEQAALSGSSKAKQAYREQLSMTKGRSMCSHCHHELAPRDLIPVLSWLWLRGRCRYCHKPIPDNPVIELLTGSVFVISYVYWPYTLVGWGITLLVVWLAIVVGLAALSLYDYRWYILPDKIVLPLTLLGLGFTMLRLLEGGSLSGVWGAFWGVVIIAGSFYVLYQLSAGRWIGGGDVKLGVLLGLLAGGAFKAFLLLFIASVAGMLVSLPLLLSGKADRRTQLPFGPFLILAACIVVIFGSHILSWYNSLLLR